MKRVESIDGIRGLACLFVMLCHFTRLFIPGFSMTINQSHMKD